MDRHVAAGGHIKFHCETTSLYSFSLKLRAYKGNGKYKFNSSLWFDPTDAVSNVYT